MSQFHPSLSASIPASITVPVTALVTASIIVPVIAPITVSVTDPVTVFFCRLCHSVYHSLSLPLPLLWILQSGLWGTALITQWNCLSLQGTQWKAHVITGLILMCRACEREAVPWDFTKETGQWTLAVLTPYAP